MTVGATGFAGSASAFDPADLQKLKDTNVCLGCDLFGANLFEANLDNAVLFNANFSFAIIEGAILCNTKMSDGSILYRVCLLSS